MGDTTVTNFVYSVPGTLNSEDTSGADYTSPAAVNVVPTIDYCHFFSSLGLQKIQIIPFEEVEITHEFQGTDKQLPLQGASMAVAFARYHGTLVAVKKPRSMSSPRGNVLSSQPSAWLRDLYFELQIMAHGPLRNHPNIVKLLGLAFEERDTPQTFSPLLVVEAAHVHHPDLYRLVEVYRSKGSFLPYDLARDLISDVADGIEALHRNDIIHGDVKPQNVLIFGSALSPMLRAKLCDFGFSGAQASGDAPKGWGTRGWTAPEIAFSAPASLRKYRDLPPQDIYSFGLVALYTFSTGYGWTPDHENTIKPLKDLHIKFDSDRESSERALQDIRDLLSSALRAEPSQRLVSLSSVRHVLRRTYDRDGNQCPDENKGSNWQEPQEKPVRLSTLRRDLARENQESGYIEYFQANAEGLKNIYWQLPSTLRRKLVEQICERIQHLGPGSLLEREHLRMLSAYAVLRGLDNSLPTMWGTSHTRYGDGPRDARRILAKSLEGMDRLQEWGARIVRNPDQVNVWDICPCMTESEFIEFPQVETSTIDLKRAHIQELISFRSRGGFNYLHAAVRRSKTDLILLLLCNGLSPNEANAVGFTPFHEAIVQQSRGEIIQTLLAFGADISKEIPTYVIGKPPPLHLAAWIGATDICKILLENGANILSRDASEMRRTAAHACAPQSRSALALLLERAPSLVHADCSHRRTPLHYAISEPSNMLLLLNSGADVNAEDINGNTPLHYAWMMSHDLDAIRRRLFPRKRIENDHAKILGIENLMSTITMQRNPHCRDILRVRGADPSRRNRIDSTPSENAFIQLCALFADKPEETSVMIGSQPSTVFNATLTPQSHWSKSSGELLVAVLQRCKAKAGAQFIFLDAVHLSKDWSYCLAIAMGRLEAAVKGTTLQVSVFKITRQPKPFAGSHLYATTKYDTHGFVKPLSSPVLRTQVDLWSLIPEANVMRRFNFGLVKITDKCDLVVQIEVVNNVRQDVGGLVLGDVGFLIEALPESWLGTRHPNPILAAKVKMTSFAIGDARAAFSARPQQPAWYARALDLLPKHPRATRWNENLPHTVTDPRLAYVGKLQWSLDLLLIALAHVAVLHAEHWPLWPLWLTVSTTLRAAAEHRLWLHLRLEPASALDIQHLPRWVMAPFAAELLARFTWSRTPDDSRHFREPWGLGRVAMWIVVQLWLFEALQALRKQGKRVGPYAELAMSAVPRLWLATPLASPGRLGMRAVLERTGLGRYLVTLTFP